MVIGVGIAADVGHLLMVDGEDPESGQPGLFGGDGAIFDGVRVVAASSTLRTSVIPQNRAKNASVRVFQTVRPV